MKNKEVVSKEVALLDLERMVNKFVKKPVPFEELEDTYPDILDGIVDGLVTFDDSGVPIYKLKNPITGESGSVVLDCVNFKTRIKPLELADIGKGLNPQKEVFLLQCKMTAFIIYQPIQMLDKFSRYDYDVIQSIASVFS